MPRPKQVLQLACARNRSSCSVIKGIGSAEDMRMVQSSELDYAQLMRRNQVMTTAVLAIEQLTGTVVGPSAAIGASSSAEVDQAAL